MGESIRSCCNGGLIELFLVPAIAPCLVLKNAVAAMGFFSYLVESARSWCDGSSDRSFMGWTH